MNVKDLRAYHPYNRHSSHFTALRTLRKLARNIEQSVASYASMAELISYFSDTFNLREDFSRTVDVLLKRGFVEANNRLDYYDESVDSIKITGYGMYMFNELAHDFTYLDLVCTDTVSSANLQQLSNGSCQKGVCPV